MGDRTDTISGGADCVCEWCCLCMATGTLAGKKKEVFCQIQSIHWPKCLSALKMFKLAVLILMVDNSCNS